MPRTKIIADIVTKHIKLAKEPFDVKSFVVHCKKSPYDVYIGRPSKWGNPFKDGTKEENIKNYETWLQKQPELLEQARKELRGKVLGCWCAPLACHGHTLARVANEETL